MRSHYLVRKIYVPRGYNYRVRFYKKRRSSSYPRFNYRRFRRIRTRYIKEEDLDQELNQIEKTINQTNNDDNKPEENKENQNQNQMKVDENP